MSVNKATISAFAKCEAEIKDARRNHALYQYEHRSAVAVQLKLVGEANESTLKEVAKELKLVAAAASQFVKTCVHGDKYAILAPVALAASKETNTPAGGAYLKALTYYATNGKAPTVADIQPSKASDKTRAEQHKAFAARMKHLLNEAHEAGFVAKFDHPEFGRGSYDPWIALFKDCGEPVKVAEPVETGKVEASGNGNDAMAKMLADMAAQNMAMQAQLAALLTSKQ